MGTLESDSAGSFIGHDAGYEVAMVIGPPRHYRDGRGWLSVRSLQGLRAGQNEGAQPKEVGYGDGDDNLPEAGRCRDQHGDARS